MSSRNCQKCGFDGEIRIVKDDGSFYIKPVKGKVFLTLTIPFLPSFYKGNFYLLSSLLMILLPSGCLIKVYYSDQR